MPKEIHILNEGRTAIPIWYRNIAFWFVITIPSLAFATGFLIGYFIWGL